MKRLPLSPAAALAAALLAAGPALATDWRQVAAHPDGVVGQAIELAPAFCGDGGQEGKEPRLTQCSVGSGALYVESRKLVLTARTREMMKGCGGLDVLEQSSFCRFTVRLVPRRVTLSTTIDPKKRIPLLEAESLDLR